MLQCSAETGGQSSLFPGGGILYAAAFKSLLHTVAFIPRVLCTQCVSMFAKNIRYMVVMVTLVVLFSVTENTDSLKKKERTFTHSESTLQDLAWF